MLMERQSSLFTWEPFVILNLSLRQAVKLFNILKLPERSVLASLTNLQKKRGDGIVKTRGCSVGWSKY